LLLEEELLRLLLMLVLVLVICTSV
jgi:hypothetical protein